MAGDILGIGVSGLNAAQRQLATAGHNISNVNTVGYSRQRAELEARTPQYVGTGYIGNGVNVQTTVRLANEFLEEQIRNSNSRFGQYDTFYALSSQIDNILANPESGLTPTLEGFYSALQEANDNPSSTPARQVLLTEANILTDRFQLIDDRLAELNVEVNEQLINITHEITVAAASIAKLNVDIMQKIGSGNGSMPNDLMDQREVLIKEIAEKIDISVIYQDDGAANVFIGSGESMVIGGLSSTLSTEINRYNSSNLDVILIQGSGKANLTNNISGGELQGIVDFKKEVLDPSRNSLGRIAIAISEEMNAQHKLGMTIQGNTAPFPLGQDFFTDLGGPIMALPSEDTITKTSLSITDSRILTNSDYRLNYDGTTLSLTRLDDNKIFTGVAGGGLTALEVLNSKIDSKDPNYNPLDPNADPQGFSLLFSNLITPPDLESGDSFLVRPTATAASLIEVKVNNVLDIALASPIVSGKATGAAGEALNSGTGEISLPTIINISDPPPNPLLLAAGITLTYTDDTGSGAPGFIVNNGPPLLPSIPYNPASDFGGREYTFTDPTPAPNYGDITFTLSGLPNVGDEFVIGNNTSPFDDNRNGLLMSALQTAKTIENSSSNFQSAYGIMVSNVGSKTHAAEVDLKAQQTLLEQANANRESYSGVNLDEEAAQLLRYQQAYQASAKVIASADQMFQTLINAV
ncbi:MAG: flagellar hook-associated protein FlgK [gamma proteobacterium symbiont of Taylorina sp.]|nr:flagellar hook-associated protein FlgK [gamma proteobacterium symbiont of Taylorina sp.]